MESGSSQVFSDYALSRRLERTEGSAGAAWVESRARLFPDRGAEWIEVAGAYAMFDGPRSPLTQTFGLGMFQAAAPADLDAIEGFFRERGAPPYHEISPLADRSTMPLLARRGYQPVEFTSVMFLPLANRPAGETSARIRARVITEAEHDLWARTAAEGWSEYPGAAEFMEEMGRVTAGAAGALPFLVRIDGEAVAAGVLFVHGGVGLLAGSSTIPRARKQGAQKALLAARLRHAAEAGCDLAMMCAEPGSASQRNAERQGFRIAYTRVKWGPAGAAEVSGLAYHSILEHLKARLL
ncbi:MAG: GNAT family N-acetyltransferase [Bryobacteraceae bacterium]|nr:GNAT family N-acetyltransferase [Bryobacteraceae bacterium]